MLIIECTFENVKFDGKEGQFVNIFFKKISPQLLKFMLTAFII